jgi:excisionase family DNA binding protein
MIPEENLTFEQVPKAIGILLSKVEAIEELLNHPPSAKEETSKFLNIDEAAAMLHKSKPTMYRLATERRFPVYKNGKQLLFKESELNEYLNQTRRKTCYEIQSEVK